MKEIQKKRLIATVKKAFPEMPWRGKPLFFEGWDYTVVIFDERYMVRIPKNKDAISRVAIDFCLLQELQRKLPVRIQKPILQNKTSRIGIYEAISGNLMTSDRYRDLTTRQKNDFAKKVAAFLTALHAVPLSSIKKCGVPAPFVRQYDAGACKYFDICTTSTIDKNLRSRLMLFQKHRSTLSKKFIATLIHGDLIDEHIFTGRTAKDPLGVIDFSDAAIDDPARDFSGLYCYGEKFVRAVYKTYGGRKDAGLIERAHAYRVDVAIKILALALKGKASMTLSEAKRFLAERLAE